MSSKLWGATFLVAGTTIGAAMLALPVSTGQSGFLPSCLMMLGAWAFMYLAAMILLEVCLAHPEDGNVISLLHDTLGLRGLFVGTGFYLFLLYALITAYLAALCSLFDQVGITHFNQSLPQWVVAVPLILLFFFLFSKGIQVLDKVNRFCLMGLAVGFCFLLIAAIPAVELQKLLLVRSEYITAALPITITAFGFHVIIPSLVLYLDKDMLKIKQAIRTGSLLALIAYVLWQIACLGSIPLTGSPSVDWAFQKGMNGATLLAITTSSPAVAVAADLFSLFAVVTSFIGVSLSLFDFLRDGARLFHTNSSSIKVVKVYDVLGKLFHSKSFLIAATFLPPLFFVLTNPRAFFIALDLAGTYGVIGLLALLPACMLWSKRYHLGDLRFTTQPLQRRGLFFFILSCSLFIFLQFLLQFGCLA
jgi:tyrosine-specific transport protein